MKINNRYYGRLSSLAAHRFAIYHSLHMSDHALLGSITDLNYRKTYSAPDDVYALFYGVAYDVL